MAMHNLTFLRAEALGYTFLVLEDGPENHIRLGKIVGINAKSKRYSFRIFRLKGEKTEDFPHGSRILHRQKTLVYAANGGSFDYAMAMVVKSTPDAPQALKDYVKQREGSRKT